MGYQLFYEEHFDRARTIFEADIENTIRALFRKGNPAGRGKSSRTAEVRRDNGWFGGADKAPAVPRDPDVISEEDLSIYAAALTRNGFFGPDSWYMNSAANVAYAARARDAGKLTLPVLFLHGAYDYTVKLMKALAKSLPNSNAAPKTLVIGRRRTASLPIEHRPSRSALTGDVRDGPNGTRSALSMSSIRYCEVHERSMHEPQIIMETGSTQLHY
jgi:pimeloyl-ACP methyl ester carboxylesterase